MLKNSIHFVLQGKGGVGKSPVSALLAQYFMSRDVGNIMCLDTDPVNGTFSKYLSLNVAHVGITDGTRINERKFDVIIERMAETDGVWVVDNGAATFLPLTSYMADNDVYEILAGMGKSVFVHSILTAGQGFKDTVNGLNQIAERVNGNAKIVLWLNEFWGKVEIDGNPFVATKLYKLIAPKVAGVVRIEQRPPDTFGVDIREMTERHETFADIHAGTHFGLVIKNRLKRVFSAITAELDQVNWES